MIGSMVRIMGQVESVYRRNDEPARLGCIEFSKMMNLLPGNHLKGEIFARVNGESGPSFTGL